MKDEYKEIFLAEALENVEQLNLYMTDLEKSPDVIKLSKMWV